MVEVSQFSQLPLVARGHSLIYCLGGSTFFVIAFGFVNEKFIYYVQIMLEMLSLPKNKCWPCLFNQFWSTMMVSDIPIKKIGEKKNKKTHDGI